MKGPGKYGRGIVTVVIAGKPFYKFQMLGAGRPKIQRCFKTFEEARGFAIATYQELGLPLDYYEGLFLPRDADGLVISDE